MQKAVAESIRDLQGRLSGIAARLLRRLVWEELLDGPHRVENLTRLHHRSHPRLLFIDRSHHFGGRAHLSYRQVGLSLLSARLILAAMPVLTLLPSRKMPDRLEFATQPTAEFSGALLATLREPTTGISAARAAVNNFVNARLRRGASVREVLGVIKSFKRQVRCNFMG